MCIKLFPCVGRYIEGNPVVFRRDFVFRKFIRQEDKLLNELKTVNCEQLMTIPLKSIEFFVDGIISTGLFILAGAPKIGKSWLALDICLSVAKGEPALNAATSQGTALYLCLEDSRIRIQNRLYEMNENREVELKFDGEQHRWISDETFSERENKSKIFIEKIFDFMIERKNFVGTATELASLLAPRFDTEVFPNRLTRDLVQNAYELTGYGIKFSSERSHGARRIRLELLSGDGSDSKNMPL